MKDLQKFLQYRLSHPLPGIQAHKKLMPENRVVFPPDKTRPKEAATLLMISDLSNEPKILLIKRPFYQGVHSGQISLPGGKKEKQDKNLKQTAIRETQEETGIFINDADIVGALSELYIPVSNFMVFTYVAVLNHLPSTEQNHEVEEIIYLPVQSLLNKETMSNFYPYEKIKAPCYIFKNYKIWGATAMILAELKEVISEYFYNAHNGPKSQ